MFSFLNSKKEEVVLLIDIGNGSTTGAIAFFSKDDKPKFIYVAKKFFLIADKVDGEKLESEMNSLLEQMLVVLINKGFEHKYWQGKKKKFDNILISFSSPWFISKTKNIHLEKDKEFVITNAFLGDVMTQEVDLLKKELNQQNPTENFEVIERSIVHSKINGYTLDNAIGKNTKSFDASLYMSVVSNNFIEKVLGTLYKYTHVAHEKIAINTFPLISFSVIRDFFTKESNFLIMDITGEVTDLTLVRGDIIIDTVTIPSGRNFVIRQIAKNFNVSTEIAESTLRLYLSKKLEDEISTKLAEVIVLVEKEWAVYIENALTELSPDMNLPSTMFLTADNDIASMYIEFMSMTKTDTTSVFRKNLRIEQINLEKTSAFYTNESGFALDEFIVLLSLFYKKLLN
jgi:hypothetical protein